jgi:hypothetical protein
MSFSKLAESYLCSKTFDSRNKTWFRNASPLPFFNILLLFEF